MHEVKVEEEDRNKQSTRRQASKPITHASSWTK